MSDPILWRAQTTTRDGRTLSVFYNPDTDLFVVDVVDADDKGGTEIVRMTLPESWRKRARKVLADRRKS